MIGARTLLIALATQLAFAAPAIAQVEAPDAHRQDTTTVAAPTARETGHGPVAQGGDAVEGAGPVDIITPHKNH